VSIFGMIFYVRGLIGVIFRYKHLIRILLCFEIIIIGLIGVLRGRIIGRLRGIGVFIVFIVVIVGERVFGLSLLVGLVRNSGSDIYESRRIIW